LATAWIICTKEEEEEILKINCETLLFELNVVKTGDVVQTFQKIQNNKKRINFTTFSDGRIAPTSRTLDSM